jgi:hypothetical protein
MRNLFFAATLMAPFTASAALPAEAYQGDLWSRITGGFKCVGQHVVFPQFIRKGEPAGVYWYAVPGKAECVKGGAAKGPQF